MEAPPRRSLRPLSDSINEHQIHTALLWPCSTSGLIKIVAGIRGVGSGRESHSFCVYVQCPVCVCVGVVRQDESEIKEGEVGGAGGFTVSILHYWLVNRERDGAEWSTANWMDWSITLHLSGGPKIPLKDKHVSPTRTIRGGWGHWSDHIQRTRPATPYRPLYMWNVCRAASQIPAEDCREGVLVCCNSRVIIKQHVKIFMVENITVPPIFPAPTEVTQRGSWQRRSRIERGRWEPWGSGRNCRKKGEKLARVII